ncbi:MAG: ATP-binding domain-containing protein [Bdellovibrionales bacterium]|nr:ATP-binding domain-containing protein [Bdellovibrionales bacterium]
MTLPDDIQQLLSEEEHILEEVQNSLRAQLSNSFVRLNVEDERARELTSSIVAARVNEEKEMLASDEAVSHQLRDMKRDEIESIDKLLKRPYFARLVLEEENDAGKVQRFEYRIGTASNPDCRIVDWRNAPISRLFYEYREGDEYSEEIQGRERNGVVVLRNTLEIDSGNLTRVSCNQGTYVKTDDGWISAAGAASGRNYGHLPDVLSLITADQFRAITEDSERAVLIRGVAGSGKTTVALYRLSWLVKNTDLRPENALIVVFSSPLKKYISGALPSLGLENVVLKTFSEWVEHTLEKVFNERQNRFRGFVPPQVRRVKWSSELLSVLEAEAEKTPNFKSAGLGELKEIVCRALKNSAAILAECKNNILDKEAIEQAYIHTKQQYDEGCIDYTDDALLIRLLQLSRGGVWTPNASPGKFDHIVIDEAQDFSVPALSAVLGSVKESTNLTFAGDAAQSLDQEGTFPGWEKLREAWHGEDSLPALISLSVSHRSTKQIMRLADYVLGERRTSEGRPGRAPLWLKCIRENRGVQEAIEWTRRVAEKYPSSITTVVCRDMKEAQHVLSLLKPTFGPAVRLGDAYNFTFDEGIIVTDVRQVKGLEFPHVLIWNPSKRAYAANRQGRNMLYTAITRAEEVLCLVTWGRHSPALPHVFSKYVRGYERESEEEAEKRA